MRGGGGLGFRMLLLRKLVDDSCLTSKGKISGVPRKILKGGKTFQGGGAKILKSKIFLPKKAFCVNCHTRKYILFQCQDGARWGGGNNKKNNFRTDAKRSSKVCFHCKIH